MSVRTADLANSTSLENATFFSNKFLFPWLSIRFAEELALAPGLPKSINYTNPCSITARS